MLSESEYYHSNVFWEIVSLYLFRYCLSHSLYPLLEIQLDAKFDCKSSQPAAIPHPQDIWQHLETFLVVKTEEAATGN